MKKIYSALLSLTLVFGLIGNSAADFSNPVDDWGVVIVPDSFSPNNNVSTGSIINGSYVTDDYLFQVNIPSSVGSTATSFAVTGSGFSSFGTELFKKVVDDTTSWISIALGSVTDLAGNSWVSMLTFEPLAINTEYAFRVFGQTTGSPAGASYGGSVEFMAVAAPVPEPEIYAMLIAGLGLMGFVARRRQRNGVVS